MSDELAKRAEDLRLEREEGGYVPAEGTEITILVRGGSQGPITIDRVSKIVTDSEAWMVWSEEGDEVTWVRSEGVVLVTSKGGAKVEGKKRPGFA